VVEQPKPVMLKAKGKTIILNFKISKQNENTKNEPCQHSGKVEQG